MKTRSVTTRKQLHRDVDALPKRQVERARVVVVEEDWREDDIGGLPEAWKTFPNDTAQPDWTALVREDRDRGH